VVALAVIVGSLVWVATQGLSSSLVYYNTPSDLLRKGHSAIGDRARLGGYVVPGTVVRQGGAIQFVVGDGTTRMTVLDTGAVPELFREGQGVVVEGALGRDGTFHADTVLIKHNGVYTPPAPGETPHSADVPGA
jgi:cytochrome c-type biogenesis protein CcmE